MFPLSNGHFVNSYVDDVCIREDYTNRPKENLPPPLPVPYLKIYPKVATKIIIYTNTYHFIIVFVEIFHAYESQIFNLTHINIESLLILYNPLQLF